MSSKVIDNQGSEARDMLANERTFLAWLRTGFATAALGIVIARLQIDGGGSSSSMNTTMSKVMALLFILLGLLCVMAGAARYAHVQILLEDNKYPTSGILVFFVTLLGFSTFIALFILLLIS